MNAEETHPEVHEEREILPRALILRVLLVSVCATAMLCIVAYLLLLARMQGLGPVSRLGLVAPHQVANVHQETFRTAYPAESPIGRQRAELERYRWVDERQGLIAIPVERAMELMLERNAGKDGNR